MRKTIPVLRTVALVMMSLILWSSCKKAAPEIQLTEKNRWILDSMKVYYYWNDQLPGSPSNQNSASVFFKSLLNTEDRFSFITDPDENREEYSSFAWYGFEYALLENQQNPGELLGTITLVVPGGPAEQQGLHRGDIFTAVNGTLLNKANTDNINRLLRTGDGLRLSMAALTNGILKTGPVLTIAYLPYTEQPVYTTRIFSNGGKKAGYIFYNQFNGSYDLQLLEALGTMRRNGINELILDLRYNPGGDVSSAAKLAGALANTRSDQTFVIYQANKNGGQRNSSFQNTMTENAYQPQSFSELLNYRLDLTRVIILTSGSTASAAELLINNLRPYINVVQIGSKTMGKDMASFAIEDFRTPKLINITLHPLVFKLYNAKEQGNYSDGLQPDYTVDEFAVLPLLPFGDPGDPLLKKALELAGINIPAIAMAQNKQSAINATLRVNKTFTSKRTPLLIETKKRVWTRK